MVNRSASFSTRIDDRSIQCGQGTANLTNFGNKVYRALITLVREMYKDLGTNFEGKNRLLQQFCTVLETNGYHFVRRTTFGMEDEYVTLNAKDVKSKIRSTLGDTRTKNPKIHDDESVIEAARLLDLINENFSISPTTVVIPIQLDFYEEALSLPDLEDTSSTERINRRCRASLQQEQTLSQDISDDISAFMDNALSRGESEDSDGAEF